MSELRFRDLARHDVLRIECPSCRRVVEYRWRRLPPRAVIADLDGRLRCDGCGCRSGFRITVWDGRARGDSAADRNERVIVEGE